MRLGEICGRTAQHLDFLLERLVATPVFLALVALGPGDARLFALLNTNLSGPIVEGADMDTKALRDLRDHNAGFAVHVDTHDIITELLRLPG